MLTKIKTFLLDVDGVVVRGKTPIVGADKAVNILRRNGANLLFITNNSTKSRKMLMSELKDANILANIQDLFTTSYCAARFLTTAGLDSVYVIGERGLVAELKEAGLSVVNEDAGKCDAVIVGLDRSFTYKKLVAAHKFITKGAKFIATNTDASLPTEDGEIPGAGAMVSSLRTSVKKRPLVLGKPNTLLLRFALKLEKTHVTLEKCAVVGDRPETDMVMARKVGCLGILVLTGVAKSMNTKDYPYKQQPTLIYPSLWELAKDYQNRRLK